MRSSYIQNDYGKVLQLYVEGWIPINAVELGVLDGYSTVHIARGFKNLDKVGVHKGFVTSYDLFEDYQYKHGKKEEVQNLINKEELSDYAQLKKGDAFKVHEEYEDGRVEFLHVDISNTGEIVEEIMRNWHPKMAPRGLVLIEGGSVERDEVDWMVQFNKSSIRKVINENPLITENYQCCTHLRFPSLTVLLRNWW